MNGLQFHDKAAEAIFKIMQQAGEPLETKEVEARVATIVKDVSRSKMIYRLQNLRADGKIRGKFVGPGKGVWIWWIEFGEKQK
jgi:hypothetical protein